MKEIFKKCSTDQRFILKGINSSKIHTLTGHKQFIANYPGLTILRV
jgi:hypothetical protein